MSVQYELAFEIQGDTATFGATLARQCGMQFDAKGNYPGGQFPTVFADGLVAAIMPQTPLGRTVIEEAYGVRSSVCIRCSPDKFELYQSSMDRLLRMCAVLLKSLECDLVLVSNGEKGWLLRKGGQVQFDEKDEFWHRKWSDVLEEFGIPFVDANLPLA